MTEQEQRQKVIEVAKTYLRTPYHHMGRVKGAGVDCLTLLTEVFHEAGIVDKIDVEYYPHDWHLHRSDERYMLGMLRHTKEVKEPQPGDIVLWKFGRCYSHAAIVISWPTVIHAYTGHGCVYEDADKAQFLKIIGERVPEQGQLREHKFFSVWAK